MQFNDKTLFAKHCFLGLNVRLSSAVPNTFNSISLLSVRESPTHPRNLIIRARKRLVPVAHCSIANITKSRYTYRACELTGVAPVLTLRAL